MNFLYNGDFKITQSWDKKSNQSKNSKQKEKDRPKSRNSVKNNNSALLHAGKNMIESLYEPSADMLDNDVAKKILRDFAAQIPPSSSNCQKKVSTHDIDPKKQVGVPPKSHKVLSSADESLVGSMAVRLKQVQMTVKCQRQQIKQKTQMLQKLKTENQFLKGLRNDSTKIFKTMEDLKSENFNLNKKITQIEAYLKKYGVKWVGYNVEGSLDHESLKKDIKKPQFNYRMPAEIDFGTIQRRVDELNQSLHAQGMGTQVYSQNGVHKFRKSESLPMAFFGNGIAIKGFKFFPYKSKESLQILSDLVDGYFPYVLKHKYPNGVFLNVIDKIAIKFDENMPVPEGNQNITNFDAINSKDFLPSSKEEFLSKLPKQVIKNGKVIQIRGAIQKCFNGQSITEQQMFLCHDFQTAEDGSLIFLSNCYKKLKEGEIEQEQICTLKIRTDLGKVCTLHLEKDSKIIDAYEWMDKLMGGQKKYVLMGNYPKKTYQKNQQNSLDSLGLFPNAMLHVHIQESKT